MLKCVGLTEGWAMGGGRAGEADWVCLKTPGPEDQRPRCVSMLCQLTGGGCHVTSSVYPFAKGGKAVSQSLDCTSYTVVLSALKI